MLDPVLTSPNLKLFADSNDTLNYKRDAGNYITQVFGAQMPAIATGFFNVHMTQGIIIQPHWHTNANELVIVISGEVITSVFNPFTQKLMTYKLKPGQVSMFPKGWFHWILTLSDKAHILTIFDQPTPDIVYGSDFLRHIPKEILHIAYCIHEEDYAKAVAPLKETVILGPPPGCGKRDDNAPNNAPDNASYFESIQQQPFGQQSAYSNQQASPASAYYRYSPPPSYPSYPSYYQQARPPQYTAYPSYSPYPQPPSYPSRTPLSPSYQQPLSFQQQLFKQQSFQQPQPFQHLQYLYNTQPDSDTAASRGPESNTDAVPETV
ncbi:cupin domain-containing protein [Paenibacillus glucanolyticus]|uniref:cupin domain-containing protein n=1 Tax=Paenibacillus glucanolyticus TaxID=59843 RepID=UPI00128BBDB1|nr:cupin domain-containing protein [Paenibacillus glucanolyticus]MPY19938.1 cupin domain-containing protein [Paenibacillus glucanolyticus]